MNHHDALFKKAFALKEVAEDYLRSELPPDIWVQLEAGSLNQHSETYVSESLKGMLSDVVYTARLAGSGQTVTLTFLFEHKSFQPSCIHFQLGAYMFGIWEKQRLNKEPATAVIPFVVYHGKKPWRHHTLADCFAGLPSGYSRYLPDFGFHLTDLGAMEFSEINQRYHAVALQLLFRLFRAAFRSEETAARFNEIIAGLQNIIENTQTEALGRAMLIYLIRMNNMPSETIKEKILELPQPMKTAFKSTYDQILEEGIEKGIEKGNERIRKTLVKTAEKCLARGMSLEETAEFAELPLAEVRKIWQDLQDRSAMPQPMKTAFKSTYDQILEEGIRKTLVKTAEKCLAKGMSMEETAELTELPLAEVRKIWQDLQGH